MDDKLRNFILKFSFLQLTHVPSSGTYISLHIRTATLVVSFDKYADIMKSTIPAGRMKSILIGGLLESIQKLNDTISAEAEAMAKNQELLNGSNSKNPVVAKKLLLSIGSHNSSSGSNPNSTSSFHKKLPQNFSFESSSSKPNQHSLVTTLGRIMTSRFLRCACAFDDVIFLPDVVLVGFILFLIIGFLILSR